MAVCAESGVTWFEGHQAESQHHDPSSADVIDEHAAYHRAREGNDGVRPRILGGSLVDA